nr:cullin, conserved site-containing protein [Tanacetum cinerariifolium]
MDGRQKRKRLCEANGQLLEKNIVNKTIDVGRNAATANVEIPAKKRKLKDQDDTPPYANTVKEKRLNTSNTDINGEEKPLIKGNGMKIKLSVSRESSVDQSHEKDLNTTTSRMDLEPEHFQFGSTLSSSNVFGSFRRASLQEVKASPVGLVSSSLLKAPNLDKVSPAAGRNISRKSHAKSSIRPEVPRKLLAREDNMQFRDIDASQSQKLGGTFELKRKEASKFTGTMSTQKSWKGSLLMSKYCGTVKDLSVVSFLKEYASSQTAMTAFKKAKESKDYIDHLKVCIKYAHTFSLSDFSIVSELAFELAWPGKNYYDVSEDETTQAVREMNFKISSQNHRLQSGRNFNSLMDSRQKRKRLCEANQQLLEKNIVNKPIDVGRNAATVNGEPRRKKLKTMADLDKHDHLTSTKIKNENKKQTQNTRASSKSKLLDRKSCKEAEIPAKKRKLKDQDDTPPASSQEVKASPVGSVLSSLLKALNLDKVSPAAGRTISRKAHAKSSIRPKVLKKLLARGGLERLFKNEEVRYGIVY